ncbi:MAG: branched-chain amino acid ABC transporter permease [Deltaproteobacteria bacterium]|nr:branched-chain amino acid ABC transporter permease [Deltaproteobacteria bacterium]
MKLLWPLGGVLLLIAAPFTGISDFIIHLMVLILIWGQIGTAWSIMGRFGLVSLGHGAFIGVGAYTMALLWNYQHLTPWIGIPLGLLLAMALALVVGYPAFRFRVVGHYFALTTLALGEVVRLSVIAARDMTGGSLGMTVERAQPPSDVSWYALQFADKRYFYFLALGLWLLGLWVWLRVERSMSRSALIAISEDEIASASIGIHVTSHKLRVTLVSAGLTAMGGILLGQYQQYLNPDSLSGIGISLEVVFASIVGGMYSVLGPTAGAVVTLLLREGLRTYFGITLVGIAETIYGLLLILCIIFMPQGILGSLHALARRRVSRGDTPHAARPGA